jgi:DNA-binding NarL/FixJ family response regulator
MPKHRGIIVSGLVLILMADGIGNTEIADRLVITPRTVAKHIEHILAKFGVHSRAQAVALAIRGEMLGDRPGGQEAEQSEQ